MNTRKQRHKLESFFGDVLKEISEEDLLEDPGELDSRDLIFMQILVLATSCDCPTCGQIVQVLKS